jgi:hypothetical protein
MLGDRDTQRQPSLTQPLKRQVQSLRAHELAHTEKVVGAPAKVIGRV